MLRKSKLIVLLLVITLTSLGLSGCYMIEEVDTKAYPIAIGIDKAGDKIELGVQFGKVIKSAEGGTPKEEGNIVIKYEGLSIYDAFEKLNNRTSKQLSYAQIKTIIVSDEFARDGIMPLVLSLVNSYHIAPNLYIMVSDGSAVNYLDNQQVWLESTPSKYYELFFDKAYYSFLNVMTISEIAFQQISKTGEIVLPYITYVKEEKKGEEGSSQKGGEDKQKGSSTEEDNNIKLDEKTKKKFDENQVLSITPSGSEISRLAVFKDGKMIGILEGDEVEAFGLIRGEYRNANITVPIDEDFSRLMNIYVQNKVKPKKTVKIIDGVPRITVDLKIEVTKISSVSAPDYLHDIEKAESAIEEYVKKICSNLLTESKYRYNSDILNFAEYAKNNFSTYDELRQYDWDNQYKNAEFDVNVKAETYTNYLVLDPNYEVQK